MIPISFSLVVAQPVAVADNEAGAFRAHGKIEAAFKSRLLHDILDMSFYCVN